MESFKNTELSEFPIKNLSKVSDLIYYEGPLLSHFISPSGDNYLYLWCDVDTVTNRWLILRVTSEKLYNYLRQKVTLLELVTSPADGFLYSVDIDENLVYRNIYMLTPENIPQSYLPEKDSYSTSEPESVKFDLLDLSRLYNSNLFNIHLKRGPGIGYGTANVSTLADLLSAFSDLAEEVTGDVLYKHKESRRAPKVDIKRYSEFELIEKRAASFSLILRPIQKQVAIPGTVDIQQEIIEQIFKLFSKSESLEELHTIVDEYSDDAIDKYQKILKFISHNKMHVEFNWASLSTEILESDFFNPTKSAKIIDNINFLEISREKTISEEGLFQAVNLKTRTYTFVQVETKLQLSKGKFAKSLTKTIDRLNLGHVYEITIVRQSLKISGKSTVKHEDIIIDLKVIEHPSELA
ncbi:MAG: DUF6575 domain-containing protein [Calditrichia bacterium]